MRRFTKTTLIALAAAVMAAIVPAAGPARAAVLTGITYPTGTLVDVDTTTGATSNPRPTGLPLPFGIAYSKAGTLYAIGTVTGEGNALVRINPATGASTLVGPTGYFSEAEGDLAFAPDGTLWGLSLYRGPLGSSLGRLFTVNTTTGAGTTVSSITVGNFTEPDFSAMAFTPSGKLYVLGNAANTSNAAAFPGNLLTVDAATGAILASVPLSTGLGDAAGMTYDATRNLLLVADGHNGNSTFPWKDDLFTLDPATGQLTVIGPTTGAAIQGLSGLAAVPLPPAVWAAVPGLALAWHLARRRASQPRPA